jgi:hypothetical protein
VVFAYSLRGIAGKQQFFARDKLCRSPQSATGSALLRLGATIELRDEDKSKIQAAIDCWLSVEASGRWLDAAPATGWLYPKGQYVGPKHQNVGNDSFRWIPGSTCGASWHAWETARAVDILSRIGGITFLGDSITQQHFHSLRSALPPDESADSIVEVQPGIYISSIAGDVPVQFIRSDDLKTVVSGDDFFPFLSGYAVLVINRGVHFATDDVFKDELRTTLSRLRAANPDVLLIWRATVHGNRDCSSYAVGGALPLQSLESLPNKATLPYNWGEMERQNTIARDLILREHRHVLIIDPLNASLLRPEKRAGAYAGNNEDCLHWGMPGPPDMWTVALVETLGLLLNLR